MKLYFVLYFFAPILDQSSRFSSIVAISFLVKAIFSRAKVDASRFSSVFSGAHVATAAAPPLVFALPLLPTALLSSNLFDD